MSKVMSPSWIEVNLHLWGHPASQDFMVENVFPLVDKILSRYPCLSWHYFLEPEVRLRFFTRAPKEVRSLLVQSLNGLRRDGRIERYHFGNHGDPRSMYHGEEEVWGLNEWPFAMRAYQSGAEYAKGLMQLKLDGNRAQYHVDRHIHLLLNQLGFSYLDEARFLLAHVAQGARKKGKGRKVAQRGSRARVI